MLHLRKIKWIALFTLAAFLYSIFAPLKVLADDAPTWPTGGYQAGGTITTTSDGPQNQSLPAEPVTCPEIVKKADPIFLHSGEFYYECSDLFIPGRGIDLDIRHFYRAGKNYSGHFGYGWTMNYHERLVRLNTGNIAIFNEEGRQIEFTYNLATDSYITPRGFFEVLTANSNGTFTRTMANGTKMNYDLNGNLSSIVDRNDNQLTFKYDPVGIQPIIGLPQFARNLQIRSVVAYDFRLTQIIDTVGRIVNFTYNADGRLDKITDFTGRMVKFTYDPTTDDLLSITKPATPEFPQGVSKTFSYDSDHNMVSLRDERNRELAFNHYDASGRVIQQDVTGDEAGSGSYVLDYGTNTTTVTDRRGIKTTYTFNSDGNLISEKIFTLGIRPGDSASFTTTYTYNTDMLRTLVRNPKLDGIKFVYDENNINPRARGNLLQIRRKTVALGADSDTSDLVVNLTYEPQFNQLKTITDPKTNVYTFIYDYELPTTDPRYGTKGNLIKIQSPTVNGQTPESIFTYNSFGQMIEAQDPNLNLVRFSYFPATGYLKEINRDPLGIAAKTQMTYDDFGYLDKLTDPNNHMTDYNYNALGWLMEEINPLQFKTKYTHDEHGNVTKVERQMDLAGTTWQKTDMTYDLFNAIKTLKDPLNQTTVYNYDLGHNLASVLDARNFLTTYIYDERDLLFKTIDANQPAGVTQYDYDINGSLTKITDANSRSTSYSYDLFNRRTGMSYPTGSSQFSFDKNSNIISFTPPINKRIEYDFDNLNRLITTRYVSTPALNKTFTYDVGSRQLTASNAAAQNTFTYDRLNRVKTNTQTINGTAYTLSYDYDPADNLAKTTYPSGKVIDYLYDANDNLTTVKVGGQVLASYNYDPLDRVATKELISTKTMRSTFTLDAANQVKDLLNTVVGGSTISQYGYTYNPVGDRKTMTAPSGALTFDYNNIEELTTVTGAQNHAYTYDNVANRKVADGVAYVPNSLNQYTQVGGVAYTYDTNGNLTKDGVNTYTYDEDNRLTTMTKTGVSASYTYDAFNRRVSKTVGGVATYFVYDGDEDIEERGSTGAFVADYVYGGRLDEVLTMTRGGQTYFYHYDALGSVVQLTNGAGTTVESYDYDPYGKLSTAQSSVGNPFYFTSRRLDSESGIYYYRARMYDPKIGRFLQRDPIGYYDSMNLYQYVVNNPANWIDPYGLEIFILGELPPWIRIPGEIGKFGKEAGKVSGEVGKESIKNSESNPKAKTCPRLGESPAVQRLQNLTGKTIKEFQKILEDAGFVKKGTTKGGYERWKHPDGSEIWKRPNGEIIRQGPKSIGKPRFKPDGSRMGQGDDHSTGEIVGKGG